MNVTGVEWRDLDPHGARFYPGQRRKRARQPASEPDEDDVVEIRDETADETADGLDMVEDP